ncbi:MAG: hypothetical protein LBW85_10655 [Deltaproteobacteria bacterium]|jgi:DNA-binding CsgD family transcriptional regulator|nr:hypothetical protein [Deltaproteobacteria bacterium]
MGRTFKFTPEELARARRFRDSPKDQREYRAGILVLLSAQQGLTRARLADAFGIDVKTVFNDMKLVRYPEAARPQNTWGGRRHSLMSLEEEELFVREHRERHLAGLGVTLSELHASYNGRVGKVTPRSTIYRLLKRHNWAVSPGAPAGSGKEPELLK